MLKTQRKNRTRKKNVTMNILSYLYQEYIVNSKYLKYKKKLYNNNNKLIINLFINQFIH